MNKIFSDMIYFAESQNIEYKSSWHDDCLKWICGFANAQGGKIYIGRNDDGKVVGLEDYKNNLTEEQLKKLGLNERQVDAMLFYRSKGKITSSEYAAKYSISDRTARIDLTDLVDKELLVRYGEYKKTKFHFR